MLNLTIAAVYAALLVETVTAARIGASVLVPEQPVKRDPAARYRGVHAKAAHLYRLAAESGRTN
ncbi:hypothetical protein OID55_28150 [Streptomyces sp. NBC_00715]|uniref:hypothetical protein n=1 Tax=unclassified Streptomyces TaxID=2593676 RepID=UPI00371E9DA7